MTSHTVHDIVYFIIVVVHGQSLQLSLFWSDLPKMQSLNHPIKNWSIVHMIVRPVIVIFFPELRIISAPTGTV